MDKGDDLYCNNVSTGKFVGCKHVFKNAHNCNEADLECIKAIFSSNLVYVPPRATDSDVVLLSVRNAMGIYFVLSFFLTGLMIAASYFWVRRVLGSASVP